MLGLRSAIGEDDAYRSFSTTVSVSADAAATGVAWQTQAGSGVASARSRGLRFRSLGGLAPACVAGRCVGLVLERKNWLTSSSPNTAIMIGIMRPVPPGSCCGFLYSAKLKFHSVIAAYRFAGASQ